MERLQKLISQAGIASRRDAEELIVQGRVTVNGVKVKLGDKADPAKDDIRVDGQRLKIDQNRLYIMLNKPKGVVTTTRAQSQEERRTVNDLVQIGQYLFPVGRLDADSEGLMLLTNDGELAERLSHPRFEHPKVYEVWLYGQIPEDKLNVWRRGVVLEEDGPDRTRPVDIENLYYRDGLNKIRITMSEGRKRQIRRIAKMLGFPVRQLIRIQLDILRLGDLRTGDWRHLTEQEISALKQSANEASPARRRRSLARSGISITPGRFDPTAKGHRSEPSGDKRSDSRAEPRGPARPSRGGATTRTARPLRRDGDSLRAERSTDEPSDRPRSAPRDSVSPEGRGPARPSRGGATTRTARPPRREGDSFRTERSADDSTDRPRSAPRDGVSSERRGPARPSRGGITTRTARPPRRDDAGPRTERTVDEANDRPRSAPRDSVRTEGRGPARPVRSGTSARSTRPPRRDDGGVRAEGRPADTGDRPRGTSARGPQEEGAPSGRPSRPPARSFGVRSGARPSMRPNPNRDDRGDRNERPAGTAPAAREQDRSVASNAGERPPRPDADPQGSGRPSSRPSNPRPGNRSNRPSKSTGRTSSGRPESRPARRPSTGPSRSGPRRSGPKQGKR